MFIGSYPKKAGDIRTSAIIPEFGEGLMAFVPSCPEKGKCRMKVFWCNIPNFGDALNIDLFRTLGGIECELAFEEEAEIMGIGSLLDCLLCESDLPYQKRNPIRVFSSGFGFGPGGFRRHRPSLLDLERMRRRVKCYAIRGLRSAERLRSFFPGIDVGTVGDAGLLVKFLVHDRVEARRGVGIVPHYADREHPIFAQLARELPDAVILNPCEGVNPFLRHLRECRTVISSAMHPLIACDALGIPNQWIRISEDTTSRFKFEDYYSIYGKIPEALDPRVCPTEELSEESIRMHYVIPAEEVEKKQGMLMKSFERLCSDLCRPRFRPTMIRPFVKLAAAFVPGKERRQSQRKKWLFEYC